MHQFFLTLPIWFSVIFSAHGTSVEFPISTTNLDQQKYLFAVSTKPARNGVRFDVTITAKELDFCSYSRVGLGILTHTGDTREGGETMSIRDMKPSIHIRLSKLKRVWTCDFRLSYGLLKKPDLCFVFTDIAHELINGKIVVMPAADLYELALRDFLKP